MTVAEFEQFIETYERDVFTFCKYLAINQDTASDLYQETILAAFEMIARIDTTNNPKSFLLAIAAGKWKNMRRKIQRRQNIAPETPLEAWSNTSLLGENPTADAAQNAALQQAVHKAIAELKDKFRIPLILHYFDDYPTETIATICNIPTGTVKSRLHKARILVKKSMERSGVHE